MSPNSIIVLALLAGMVVLVVRMWRLPRESKELERQLERMRRYVEEVERRRREWSGPERQRGRE